MLYLGIDLHKAQITINLRNEQRDVVEKAQISTDHDAINDYFAKLFRRAKRHRGFMAIFEVCGFHDWLYEKFKKLHCKEIVIVQPDYSSNKKTDRRDANALCELLWNNRKRLCNGARPNGIRRIFPASSTDAQVRQLANFRQFLITQRTKTINKIRGILRKHNMGQDAPSKDYKTNKNRSWLEKVVLPVVDRLEVDAHLSLLKTYDKEISTVEEKLVKQYEGDKRRGHAPIGDNRLACFALG